MLSNLKDLNKNKELNLIYKTFINDSQLPYIYSGSFVNPKKLPSKLKIFYDNILKIINERYDYVVIVNDENYLYFVALLLDKYFLDSINNETLPTKLLYIDTPILLRDFKAQINNNVQLYSEEIKDNIYKLRYIIWDNLQDTKSEYDINKMQEILKIRYINDYGNIFIINTNTKDNMSSIQNIKKLLINYTIIDCTNQKITLYTSDTKEGT